MKITGKAIAAGSAVAVLLSTFSLIGASASIDPKKAFPTKPVTLTMWWWGEQEAPGAQAWLDKAVIDYKKKRPNVTIKTVLQTTDGLIPAFSAAAAANAGADPLLPTAATSEGGAAADVSHVKWKWW
jgi:multiple sugar transport system substrate-binding protein